MINAPSLLTRAFPAARRFRIVVFACAVLASAVPTFALWAQGGSPGAVALALGGSCLALLVLIHLLEPLEALAVGLDDCLGEEAPAARRPADPRGAGGMVGEITELARRVDGMRRRLTNRHPVTGFPTREPFLAELAGDIQGAEGPLVLGVLRFSDYDRLAAFDQDAADEALRAFGERLRGSLPPARPVAQIDRGCFAIWFGDARERDAAARELQALSYVLSQELRSGEMKLTPNIAIGASVYPDDGATPADLLTRAVAALEGEREDGAAVAFFSTQGSGAARERFSLEQGLHGAIGRDEFVLQYQPVVDAEAGRVVGAEALLRWRHSTLGLLAPDQFIPILEQSPMMAEVGLWVLNAACREARSWRDQGLDDLTVAVNLSTAQCRDPRLNEMVRRTLERHDLPSSRLELELTETAALEDADHTRRLFGQLRNQGVAVAIDDFGAGYSSLSYLKNLPFSKLKIDREFVTEVDQRRDSRAICASLIALAAGLGISVLAEGVETQEEVATLRAMGCRLFQGFFFARPMDAGAFVDRVRDPAWLKARSSPSPAPSRQPRLVAP